MTIYDNNIKYTVNIVKKEYTSYDCCELVIEEVPAGVTTIRIPSWIGKEHGVTPKILVTTISSSCKAPDLSRLVIGYGTVHLNIREEDFKGLDIIEITDNENGSKPFFDVYDEEFAKDYIPCWINKIIINSERYRSTPYQEDELDRLVSEHAIVYFKHPEYFIYGDVYVEAKERAKIWNRGIEKNKIYCCTYNLVQVLYYEILKERKLIDIAHNKFPVENLNGWLYRDLSEFDLANVLFSKLYNYRSLEEIELEKITTLYKESINNWQAGTYKYMLTELKNPDHRYHTIGIYRFLKEHDFPYLKEIFLDVMDDVEELEYEGNVFTLVPIRENRAYEIIDIEVNNPCVKLPGTYKWQKIESVVFATNHSNIEELHIPKETRLMKVYANISASLKKVVCSPENQYIKTDDKNESIYYYRHANADHKFESCVLISALIQNNRKILKVLPGTIGFDKAALAYAMCDEIECYDDYTVETSKDILYYHARFDVNKESGIYKRGYFVFGGIRYHLSGSVGVCGKGELGLFSNKDIDEFIVESDDYDEELAFSSAFKCNKLTINSKSACSKALKVDYFWHTLAIHEPKCVQISDSSYLREYDGHVITADGKQLYFIKNEFDKSVKDEFAIPEGVEVIEGNIFELKAKTIHIPDSLKEMRIRDVFNLKSKIIKGSLVGIKSLLNIIVSYTYERTTADYIRLVYSADKYPYLVSGKSCAERLLTAINTNAFQVYLRKLDEEWTPGSFSSRYQSLRARSRFLFLSSGNSENNLDSNINVVNNILTPLKRMINDARDMVILKKEMGYEGRKCEEAVSEFVRYLAKHSGNDEVLSYEMSKQIVEYIFESGILTKNDYVKLLQDEHIMEDSGMLTQMLEEINKIDSSDEGGSIDSSDDFDDI